MEKRLNNAVKKKQWKITNVIPPFPVHLIDNVHNVTSTFSFESKQRMQKLCIFLNTNKYERGGLEGSEYVWSLQK